MAEQSLRGSNLGFHSHESEHNVVIAPRRIAEYVCKAGHVTTLPFSVDAEAPDLWECRCGLNAQQTMGPEPEIPQSKPVRTHWDMLLERRTEAELQKLLDERLDLLRKGRLHANGTTKKSA